MSFQRVEYPEGVVSSGLKLKYMKMTRTIFNKDKPSILIDESMEPLVLPPGATIERVRVLPPMHGERQPYPTTTVPGNPIIELLRVSTDGAISKQIRTYATTELGSNIDLAPFSQGLITNGLALDVKTIETGVCVSLLVGSKANTANASEEGSGATKRPTAGGATLQQYNDESAFANVASHLTCTFSNVTGTIFDVTIVVEYTIGRASFLLPDSGWQDVS